MQRTAKAAAESITSLLARVNHGDREAFDRLIPLVYQELHRIAKGYLRREFQKHTLQPTALINEAYLRLVDYRGAEYQNRTHFYAVAARVMRQILVDHARARCAVKRGADVKVSLDPYFDCPLERDRTVMALDEALNALANKDERKARLVEMRFFGGMSTEEIAEREGMPAYNVRRELLAAQAWLRREIAV